MVWRRVAAAAIAVAVGVWRWWLCCIAAAVKLNYSFRWHYSFLLGYLTIRTATYFIGCVMALTVIGGVVVFPLR